MPHKFQGVWRLAGIKLDILGKDFMTDDEAAEEEKEFRRDFWVRDLFSLGDANLVSFIVLKMEEAYQAGFSAGIKHCEREGWGAARDKRISRNEP